VLAVWTTPAPVLVPVPVPVPVPAAVPVPVPAAVPISAPAPVPALAAARLKHTSFFCSAKFLQNVSTNFSCEDNDVDHLIDKKICDVNTHVNKHQ
jgi:hypothetical protein